MIKYANEAKSPDEPTVPLTGDHLASGLTETLVRNLFHQVVLGLIACHSKGVVHRDLKPSNLQLTCEGVVKIIDFGVAENLDQFSESEDTVKFAGTPAFQPPEVANGSRTFKALKVDIWAAGVTLYVMATGKTPFAGDKIEELYATISRGEYELPEVSRHACHKRYPRCPQGRQSRHAARRCW